jgi:hypothetical protein
MNPTTSTAPTVAQFAAYKAMFDHFNATLFGGTLPEVPPQLLPPPERSRLERGRTRRVARASLRALRWPRRRRPRRR